ncbi:ABC1 family-domain-containing protein [Gongronella butleri]|nr:ABC1 family-domain-containing protein [Gongronella butleri]
MHTCLWSLLAPRAAAGSTSCRWAAATRVRRRPLGQSHEIGTPWLIHGRQAPCFARFIATGPATATAAAVRRLTRWRRRGGVFAIVGAGFYALYEHHDGFRHGTKAILRVGTASWIGLSVAWQYQRAFLWLRWQGLQDTPLFEKRKRECHAIGAQRVLAGLQDLGGIYVKLGQHLSAMKHILPLEWTRTLAVLQDRCDPSSRDELEQLFLHDCGVPIDDVFDMFDWDAPLGIASLASVYRARLRTNGQWIALKLQHPRIDEFCQMDLDTVAILTRWIQAWFPDFGFEWILHELQDSLPQELDFRQEASHAKQVQANFAGVPSTLVVPEILWAQRRILCMEYVEGARIDDIAYMKAHHIDPSLVSMEITKIFAKMMFLDGFVHCDPHPGNLMIRPSKKDANHGYNFDVVLLDHGLYRPLTDQLRTDFAHLWTALIRGYEPDIEKYALRVGCRPSYHRLFASLLTGREWHTIVAADLASARTATEIKRVSGRSKVFLHRIAAIFATLPQIVFLLLKTSDLVRHLNETLLTAKQGSRRTYVIMAQFCAQAVWEDTRQELAAIWAIAQQGASNWQRGWTWLTWCSQYVSAWCQYQVLTWSLWLHQ